MAMKGLNYYTKDEVDELLGGQGGFMKKSVYDTNDSGVSAQRLNTTPAATTRIPSSHRQR